MEQASRGPDDEADYTFEMLMADAAVKKSKEDKHDGKHGKHDVGKHDKSKKEESHKA